MGSAKKTISYRYDAVGNRVGMTDSDGGRFTYAWDAVNRITHLVNPQGDRTTYAYDPSGRRTVKKLANGTRASFTYDTASNLTKLSNLKSDNTVISSFDYAYDKTGNRTSVVEADGSRVTWSYDDTYQLTGEHRTGSNGYEDTYSYDPAGNRLLKIHDGTRTTSTYDAANQLNYSEDASGRTTYTFDADGNQGLVLEPDGDRTTTTWDYENRTTLVQLPTGIRNSMAYEPGGLRVKLEESTGTKKFVWDDQNYLAETDENDDTQVVYTNEPRVYGNLVSQRRGTDSHWYHFDAIGSTRDLTDTGELVTDTRMYDAWGTKQSASGTTQFPFQYIASVEYYTDPDTSSQYVRARVYFPSIGRWASYDPAFPLDALNAYVMSSSNPTNMLDPSGQQCEPTPLDTDQCVPRGRFTTVKLSPRDPIEDGWGRDTWNRRVGSDFMLTWSPYELDPDTGIYTANPFVYIDENGQECCCCDEVVVVQIVKQTMEGAGWYDDAHDTFDWRFDSGFVYPKGTNSINPCSLSERISITDAPNFPVSRNPRRFVQSMETCILCYHGGPEEMKFEGTVARGVTVYGCVTWGHTFKRKPGPNDGVTVGRPEDYAVTSRWISCGNKGKAPPGERTPPEDVVEVTDCVGKCPSDDFKGLVLSGEGQISIY